MNGSQNPAWLRLALAPTSQCDLTMDERDYANSVNLFLVAAFLHPPAWLLLWLGGVHRERRPAAPAAN